MSLASCWAQIKRRGREREGGRRGPRGQRIPRPREEEGRSGAKPAHAHALVFIHALARLHAGRAHATGRPNARMQLVFSKEGGAGVLQPSRTSLGDPNVLLPSRTGAGHASALLPSRASVGKPTALLPSRASAGEASVLPPCVDTSTGAGAQALLRATGSMGRGAAACVGGALAAEGGEGAERSGAAGCQGSCGVARGGSRVEGMGASGLGAVHVRGGSVGELESSSHRRAGAGVVVGSMKGAAMREAEEEVEEGGIQGEEGGHGQAEGEDAGGEGSRGDGEEEESVEEGSEEYELDFEDYFSEDDEGGGWQVGGAGADGRPSIQGGVLSGMGAGWRSAHSSGRASVAAQQAAERPRRAGGAGEGGGLPPAEFAALRASIADLHQLVTARISQISSSRQLQERGAVCKEGVAASVPGLAQPPHARSQQQQLPQPQQPPSSRSSAATAVARATQPVGPPSRLQPHEAASQRGSASMGASASCAAPLQSSPGVKVGGASAVHSSSESQELRRVAGALQWVGTMNSTQPLIGGGGEGGSQGAHSHDQLLQGLGASDLEYLERLGAAGEGAEPARRQVGECVWGKGLDPRAGVCMCAQSGALQL